MKKQKNILRCMYWALPCALLLAGCDNGISQENAEPVELQINPVVATTRSAIQEASAMDKVAVYATGDDYTTEKSNNYAVYTYSGGNWSNNDTSNKIFLTNKPAVIYGYYPTTEKYNDTDKTISVTILEGDASTTTITAVDNATGTAIASAAGEVDCMWATSVSDVSNAANKNKVKLQMKHALSMVSFRVYKDASYKGAGSLTKFIVENAAGKNTLSKGTSPKMKITDGTITPGTAQNAKYTRTINGYTMTSTSADSKKFSILVLPTTTTIGNDNIQATFTVDGADYSVNLKAPTVSGTDGKWLAGNNNLYTVKLGGTEPEVTVEVTKWSEIAGGDLEIK